MVYDRDRDLIESLDPLSYFLQSLATRAMDSEGVNLVWKQDRDGYRQWEIERVVVRRSEKRSLGSVCRTEVLTICRPNEISVPALWHSS